MFGDSQRPLSPSSGDYNSWCLSGDALVPRRGRGVWLLSMRIAGRILQFQLAASGVRCRHEWILHTLTASHPALD